MSYFPPFIDETGVHLPTYEDRLDQLLSDYRRIFGTDLILTPDTQDYQLCSIFAKALDDMSSLFLSGYAARDPDLAAGQALDLLLPLNGITRLPGESDAAARLRRSNVIAAPSISTREALLSALSAVPYLKGAIIWENDTDDTDDQGLPPHSIRVVVDGGANIPVAQAILSKKPVGVTTDGSVSVTVPDEFGTDRTVHFSRVSNIYLMITVYIRTFAGYDSSVTPDAIKAAVKAYIDKQVIGQDVIVPSIYSPVMALNDPDHPTFAISSLAVNTSETSSSIKIAIGPGERASVLLPSINVSATPMS